MLKNFVKLCLKEKENFVAILNFIDQNTKHGY